MKRKKPETHNEPGNSLPRVKALVVLRQAVCFAGCRYLNFQFGNSGRLTGVYEKLLSIDLIFELFVRNRKESREINAEI